ncbi:hypothetical protein NQ315_005774 [Exocentrus adspersus]|uniref:Alcohol dehydrogenase-like N-terminal domain-containing protein n=1 Tax=Exocentrus adspersus TaxID=1586481 RepID=A0AAV8VRY0_9CUCU|nr:hypothetical protein NQ315_005774 [Exocentrus adspersus]
MEQQKSRSVVIKKFGGYDCLLVEDFNLPKLEEYIEVKVDYGGLNFADLYTRQGVMLNKKLPFVLGIECTGTITSVASATTGLSGLGLGYIPAEIQKLSKLFSKTSISQGIIIPKIYTVVPMSRIVEATKLLGNRENVGKVLIQMKGT